MTTVPVLRYIIAGQLQRSFILNHQGRAILDVPGGSLLHAATGVAIWERGVGLIARVGENYPQEWLAQAAAQGFDTRGVHILTEEIDHRYFAAYPDPDNRSTDNPVSHFARLGMPFPKSLLGFNPPPPQLDSRLRPSLLTIRQNDFPTDYLDATAAHLCPMDFLSHTLLPSILRQGHIQTITLDPGASYMNPVFLDDMPVLMSGLTAMISSEAKINGLFQGRSTDLWEMAEALAGFGCEMVVIKRGSQGQYVYNHASRSRWIIPSYPVQVMEPTGAGDAFCGGFLAGFRGSYDPLHAALTGNISASMVIEGSHPFYALDSLPGLAKARLEALRERVRKI